MAAAFGAHAQDSQPGVAADAQAAEAPADTGAAGATPEVAATDASSSANGGIEEVIVTARRRSESLQDVPQTVDAVSSDTLQKLNIQKFEDIEAIVPGLTMSSGTTGYTTAATIRGASFEVESGSSPTVEFYVNDAPIQSTYLFNSMFDVGQIEVLRGPQGTLRGRASPSGSITVATRAPDLYEAGGYAELTRTNLDALNVNGAFNLPIIPEKLAIRIAGIDDRNEGDHVRSIHSNVDPSAATKAYRASLRFEPTDAISANVMYQHLQRNVLAFNAYQSYDLVDPTATAPDPDLYRTIHAGDRLGIAYDPRNTDLEQEILTAQLEWRFAGQKLSYVGSNSSQDLHALSPQDGAGIAGDYDFNQDLNQHASQTSHELRLSSDERLFGFLDYTIGGFHQVFNTPSDLTNVTLVGIQTGQYTIRPAATVPTAIERSGGSEETSFFTNLTAHVGERAELSAGVRHISYKTNDGLVVSGNTLEDAHGKDTPTVYNLSAAYHFTDDLMTYVNYGTSWRHPSAVVGVFRPMTPNLDRFTHLKPEKSNTIEAGLKADFLDRRVRLAASVYHQDYDNYQYRGPSVYFVDLDRNGPKVGSFNFVSSVKGEVNGVELALAVRPITYLNVSAAFSYAKGKIKNGAVACNDFDGNGAPDRFATVPSVADIEAAAGGDAVASCTINDRLSFAPTWNLVLTPEYAMPVTDHLDGFLRGLYTYTPKNRQDPNNPYDNVSAYGLLNLYTGIRSHDGSWEVSLFAKNLTDEGQLLGVDNGPATTGYQALQPPDYTSAVGASMAGPYMNNVRYTPPREVGVSIHYAFGSH